jgi:hypothetical protein
MSATKTPAAASVRLSLKARLVRDASEEPGDTIHAKDARYKMVSVFGGELMRAWPIMGVRNNPYALNPLSKVFIEGERKGKGKDRSQQIVEMKQQKK